jgi:2-polyprenyl-3-methyl-5-hydroxy-6-metoxy-1,4-benzoquinol methylase
MSTSETPRCPCCCSGEIRLNAIRRRFWLRVFDEHRTYEYAICHVCGHLWATNALSQADLDRYYAAYDMFRRETVDEIERQVFAEVAAQIQRHRSIASAHVLEIGCDTGQFLDHLATHHEAHTYFDEHSERAVAIIEAKKLHTRLVAETAPPSFDIIIARHVFEHVLEPARWLRTCLDRLSSGGVVFLEVPGWSYLDENLDLLNFEHVHQFNNESLVLVIRQAGGEVLSIETRRTPGHHSTPNRVIRVCIRRAAWADVGHEAYLVRRVNAESDLYYHNVGAVLQRAASSGQTVALYAASWLAQDLLLNGNFDSGVFVGIFDADPAKIGTQFFGLSVRSPTEIIPSGVGVMLVLSSYEREITQQLLASGFAGEVIPYSQLVAGPL